MDDDVRTVARWRIQDRVSAAVINEWFFCTLESCRGRQPPFNRTNKMKQNDYIRGKSGSS
ncbi:hypothetical protein C7S15_4672 [Burkholderia cepacia]|nr:hypothetical protein [Burkholderia cepacia]